MGNFNSGFRREKKTLTRDCTFIDSYKLTSFESLPLVINSQYRQQINVSYNDKKRHGGRVKYFECPFCLRRARFLYVKSNRLACRTCQELTYESSQSKNHFNFVAKWFIDYGLNEEYAKKIFRPRKNQFF